MRTDLKVPFAEKDDAKKLGARWDPARKVWYVQDKDDLAPFARWSPTPHAGGGNSAPAAKTTDKVNQSEGIVIVGMHYKPLPRVCECLPWEDCDKCRTSVAAN
ncbi:hypothetical protein DLREEDagrD3_14320 [Denitratisoma sp. agr-D3]